MEIMVMKMWLFAKRTFMTFWYPYVRTLNSIWPSITIQGKRLVIFPDVYKPLENEYACAEYCREGDRMLDLGCGSGVGAVFCAPKVRELVAVDISPSAVRNTEENCRLNGLNNVVVKQSDMFSDVEGKFDLILANPPYIEAEFESEEEQYATSVRYLPTLFAQVGDGILEAIRDRLERGGVGPLLEVEHDVVADAQLVGDRDRVLRSVAVRVVVDRHLRHAADAIRVW